MNHATGNDEMQRDAAPSELETAQDLIADLKAKLAAAESESAGLRKERDELQEMLRQIPNT